MIVRTLLALLLVCSAQAVLNKDLKRREAFDHYGPPPRPAPQYGPPPPSGSQHVPHREYGVPQQIPFRDYGPPALKHGPAKLNFITAGISAASGFGGGLGLHEQIKSHFGLPKPFYGPPHVQYKPSATYGPPRPQYGPPPLPLPQYGPPLQNTGPHPPRPNYGAPSPASLLSPSSSSISSPNHVTVLRPVHRPASSYGPPPSGPLQQRPQLQYGPPRPVSRPHLPNLQQTNPFGGGVPETTIIVAETASPNQQHGPVVGDARPVQQVQVQVDASGHTHSVSGSQAPFHTSCEGWKPIASPVGTYVQHNHIEQQTGYSQVSQASLGTQYHAGAGLESGSGGPGGNNGGSGGIVNGLTDEQLVAVALQAGNIGGSANVQVLAKPLPPTGPGGDFEQHNLNSIESNEIQILGAVGGDSYSRPPPDSFPPGSIHAQKYTQIRENAGVHGLVPPSGNYGPPLSSGIHHSLATQPSTPVAFRPPVPQGLIESIGATVQHLDQFGVKPPHQAPTYIPPAANEIGHSGPASLGPEYAAPSAPTHIIFEQQLPEQIAPQTFFQVNPRRPQPQLQRPPTTQLNPLLSSQQQQHSPSNVHSHYGIPPPPGPISVPSPVPLSPPEQQYLPPPPPPPALQQGHNHEQPTQHFLPPPPPPPLQQPRQPSGTNTYHHSFGQNHLENAFSSSQNNEQFVHVQGLPALQPHSRFHQVHDCGHGPNLIGTGYQSQQQQHAHPQKYEGLSNAFNAIAPSIPVGEQHSHFISGPADSYGPPPSGNVLDHIGLTSQKSPVAALPDGTDPQTLPGLDGVNVVSAQKSQSIQIPNPIEAQNQQQSAHTYQLQFGNSAGSQLNGEQSANHEEILSEGLLQSILTAIEQPNSKDEQQLQEPRYNQAQSRADQDFDSDEDEGAEHSIEPAPAESSQSSVIRVTPRSDEGSDEVAQVSQLKAIVPLEEAEQSNH